MEFGNGHITLLCIPDVFTGNFGTQSRWKRKEEKFHYFHPLFIGYFEWHKNIILLLLF